MKNCLAAIVLMLAALTSQATPVLPNGSLFDLGNFAAGTYTLTGSGVIDLCGNGTFSMRPDGTPNATITCGNYGSYFNTNGSYTADGTYARAGANAKIGALIGTLNAAAFTGINPTSAQADDWFLIGYSVPITLSAAGHIYASVNDTYYPNDTGAFDVRVTAVPEPGVLGMMALGLLLFGGSTRRRVPSCACASGMRMTSA